MYIYTHIHGMDPMGRAGEGCALRRSVLGRLCMLGSGGVLRRGRAAHPPNMLAGVGPTLYHY